MVDGVRAHTTVSIKGKYFRTVDTSRPVVTLNPITRDTVLVPGTGIVGRADVQYSAMRTLAGSQVETIDLVGGLEDKFGNVINCQEVVSICILPAKTNTGPIKVGGGSFHGPLGAGTIVTVRPGGVRVMSADRGWPVVPSTGDGLRIENGGAGEARYEIIIFARSAASVASIGVFDFSLPSQSGLLALLLEDF